MQSKTSFFNMTLYKKLLSRFWPMWGGLGALACLVPLVLLLFLLRQPHSELLSMEMENLYYVILVEIAPIFMLIYAVFCAMAVWGYLYQHRSVSLMHTLPITRSGLFVTGCAAGLTFILLPLGVAGGLLFLVSAAAGAAAPLAFFQCAAGLVLLALLYFGFATLCAMVTGHMLALPVFYFLGNFLAVLLDELQSSITGLFLFGVTSGYTGAVEWLSPTVYLMRNLGCEAIWDEENTRVLYYQLTGMSTLLLYGLAGLALLALAWLIYRRRPSESAGDVVSLPILRPLFKLGVGVFSALSLGQVLYHIFGLPADGDSLVRMGVCMFVAGALGFWVANMLVQKSLRVLRTSAVGAGAMALLALAFCLVVHFDLLGVEGYVPKQDEVVNVTLNISYDNYAGVSLSGGADDEAIGQLLAVHQGILDSKQDILAITHDSNIYYYSHTYGMSEDNAENYKVYTLWLTYLLSNGKVVTRRYPVTVSQALMADGDSYAARLEDLLNDPALQLKRVLYNSVYEPYWATFWSNNGFEDGGTTVELDIDESRQLYTALVEDVKAGRWGRVDLLNGGYEPSVLECCIELRRRIQDDSQGYHYNTINILVRPEMSSTIQALLDLGVDPAALELPEEDPTSVPGAREIILPA